MKRILQSLHGRLGDFWWYTAMLFFACRAADVLNLFVGAWLVPKLVNPEELGAVLPLTSFASVLAVPAAVFATTFMKEVNSLATAGEFGKLKTLLGSVFIAAFAILAAALGISRLCLPWFLDRIRIAEGSLGWLILAASFIGCVAPVYVNALQALKKFKSLSFLHLVCAPARLVTMLVAMPFRALSGYFAGQAAAPAANILVAVCCLKKELSVKAERYWSRPIVKRFAVMFLGIGAYQLASTLLGLFEQTAVRQNLPAVESAAYYMVTRFSDIANCFSSTLIAVLFPFTAEAACKGRATRPFVVKASLAVGAASLCLAAFFAFAGKPVLGFLPHGAEYSGYAWAIPLLILINILTIVQTLHTGTEISAARFRFLWWWIPLNLALPVALAFLPIASLKGMIGYFAAAAALKFAFSAADLIRQREGA